MTLHGVLEFLHIIVCLTLIAIVMVQASEGEGLSGAFGGGGSYALFGKRGATGFIAKATTGAAVMFMITSFGLTYLVQKNAPSASSQTGAPMSSSPLTGAPLAQ